MDALRLISAFLIMATFACKSSYREESDLSEVRLSNRDAAGYGTIKVIQVPELKGSYVAHCAFGFKRCDDRFTLTPLDDFQKHLEAATAKYEKEFPRESTEADVSRVKDMIQKENEKLQAALPTAEPGVKERLEFEIAVNNLRLGQYLYEGNPESFKNTVKTVMDGLTANYEIALDTKNSHVDMKVVEAIMEVRSEKAIAYSLVKVLKDPRNAAAVTQLKNSKGPVGTLFVLSMSYRNKAPTNPYLYIKAPGLKTIQEPVSMAGATQERSIFRKDINRLFIASIASKEKGTIEIYEDTSSYRDPRLIGADFDWQPVTYFGSSSNNGYGVSLNYYAADDLPRWVLAAMN